MYYSSTIDQSAQVEDFIRVVGSGTYMIWKRRSIEFWQIFLVAACARFPKSRLSKILHADWDFCDLSYNYCSSLGAQHLPLVHVAQEGQGAATVPRNVDVCHRAVLVRSKSPRIQLQHCAAVPRKDGAGISKHGNALDALSGLG